MQTCSTTGKGNKRNKDKYLPRRRLWNWKGKGKGDQRSPIATDAQCNGVQGACENKKLWKTLEADGRSQEMMEDVTNVMGKAHEVGSAKALGCRIVSSRRDRGKGSCPDE